MKFIFPILLLLFSDVNAKISDSLPYIVDDESQMYISCHYYTDWYFNADINWKNYFRKYLLENLLDMSSVYPQGVLCEFSTLDHKGKNNTILGFSLDIDYFTNNKFQDHLYTSEKFNQLSLIQSYIKSVEQIQPRNTQIKVNTYIIAVLLDIMLKQVDLRRMNIVNILDRSKLKEKSIEFPNFKHLRRSLAIK
jgi:hypothetical protein